MRLAGVAMVRNEADVIESFVRHNLGVLDRLALVDHGSHDGTSEILAALIAEGLPLTVERDDSAAFTQPQVVTRLVRAMLREPAMDFVAALDADEFLKLASRAEFERWLAQVPAGAHVLLPWHTYVPASFDEAVPMTTRLAGAMRVESPNTLMKVVAGRALAETDQAFVSSGNHMVVRVGGGANVANPHAKLPPSVASLAHVPVRSARQFTSKIAVGWIAHRAAAPNHPQLAFHWREAYASILAGEPLTPAALTTIACNYSVPRAQWRAAQDVARIADPFLAPIALRHAHLARIDPLANVLHLVERLLAADSPGP